MKRNAIVKMSLLAAVASAVMLLVVACGAEQEEQEPISLTISDMSWDSVRVHNRIVAFILQHGYGGYEIDYTEGSTVAMVQGMRRGDNDIILESWHNNYEELWAESTEAGDIVDLGPNYKGAPQGWYVPTYVIEGDPERDIEPMAPDLQSIDDLPEYWDVFRDAENPDKGRIMVGPPGWAITETNQELLEETGLDEYYVGFLPGSDAALKASMESAVRRGDPWLGYHWEPTWIIGKLDMTRLEGVGLPTGFVHKIVNRDLPDRAPDVVEFLENYETTLDQNNAFLAQMQENDWEYDDAAEWFLSEHEDTWTQWVSDEVAERVREALE